MITKVSPNYEMIQMALRLACIILTIVLIDYFVKFAHAWPLLKTLPYKKRNTFGV